MAKTQFTKTKKSISPKRALAVLLAVFVTFILFSAVINVAQKYFAIKRHMKDLTVEHESLKQKHDDLKTKNDYLATTEGQEEALREKFNIIKAGEGMIVVASNNTANVVEHKSSISRFWDSIIGGLGFGK